MKVVPVISPVPFSANHAAKAGVAAVSCSLFTRVLFALNSKLGTEITKEHGRKYSEIFE